MLPTASNATNPLTLERINVEMNAQFAHYWREGVILSEEESEHQRNVAKALNQGFVFTVPEGSELNGTA